MNRFKKAMRFAALILSLTAFFTVPSLADSGPKPQLIVRMQNVPEEPYYLDLLAEGDPDPEYLDFCLDWNYPEKERAVLDPELLQALRDSVPKGWFACVAQGNQGRPIYGALTGDGNLHAFGYVGVPDTYRVIIVTKGGESWVSEPLTRHALQCSAQLDWAEKTLSAPPVWVGYVLQFLSTCVPTLVIEALILLLYGYKWNTSWKPFLAVNLVTQGAFSLFFSVTAMSQGIGFLFLFLFIPAEVVIAITESLLYRRFLIGRGTSTAVAYGLTANAASAILGVFLADPLWRFVVSIS